MPNTAYLAREACSRKTETADHLDRALASGEARDWLAFAASVKGAATPHRRAGLLWAALHACEPEECDAVLAAFSAQAGAPVPPLESAVLEAENWAAMADRTEIDAYAIACVNKMPRSRRQDFLRYLSGVAV